MIFTTAYNSHALAAIEANAVDYLLKPIRKPRLRAALERATTLTRAQLAGLEAVAPEGDGPRARTHISATLYGNLQLLPLGEIRFFRAEHKYVTARHPGGQLIIEDPLGFLAPGRVGPLGLLGSGPRRAARASSRVSHNLLLHDGFTEKSMK